MNNPGRLLAAFLLTAPAAALPARAADTAPGDCTTAPCHAAVSSAPFRHDPVEKGECEVCHRPRPGFAVGEHSSDSFDLPEDPRESCLGCHEKTARELESPVAHPPAAEGDCSACHDPHGSSYPSLLLEAYPDGAHLSFDLDSYALCWDCHDSSLATEKFTLTATAFRKGGRNFHYSHLHKRKGIACGACHSPHGGQLFLIRSSAPRGAAGWSGRMRFQAEQSGGRCDGGCHKDLVYQR